MPSSIPHQAPAGRLSWVPHPWLVILVGVGGTVGTLGRYGVGVVLPTTGGWPWATLTVNLTGALVLGVLLEYLAQRGPETPAAERVRLGLGTGLLGGYTTYSSFAAEADRLLGDGHLVVAVGYVAVSLVGGLAAAAAGVAAAARHRRWREATRPVDPDTPVGGR